MSEETPEEEFGEFAEFQLPPEFVAGLLRKHGELKAAHERQVMELTDIKNRVMTFIEDLTPEQAVCLRKILNSSHPAKSNQFFDGLVYGHMLHLGLDPDTGKNSLDMDRLN